MKYEVGLIKILFKDGRFAVSRGEPIISKVICNCTNLQDALLVSKNNTNDDYIAAIRDDEENRWYLSDDYPVKIKEIENLDFKTVPAQWAGRDSRAMWDKINEIIDYINNKSNE